MMKRVCLRAALGSTAPPSIKPVDDRVARAAADRGHFVEQIGRERDEQSRDMPPTQAGSGVLHQLRAVGGSLSAVRLMEEWMAEEALSAEEEAFAGKLTEMVNHGMAGLMTFMLDQVAEMKRRVDSLEQR